MSFQFALLQTPERPRVMTQAGAKFPRTIPPRKNLACKNPVTFVIPSDARNLLFLRGTEHTASYRQGSGGSAGTVEGLGGTVGFAGVTGLFAAGLLCDATLPTVRYLRIFSSRFGPIPRTARKSSTLLNAP